MLPSFLISLREGLEAALIIGVVLSTLEKSDHRDYFFPVWQGVLAAGILSLAIGIGLNLIGSEFSGKGENLFEGVSMISAAVLLTWMVIWMGRTVRSRQIGLQTGIRQAVSNASRKAVFMLAFVAVLRELTELAFFLFAAGLGTASLLSKAGTALGLICASSGGWLVYKSTHKLNLHRFFQVTNLLLVFVAAGLVAHGAREFIEAGWLAPGISHLWDTTFLLNDQSVIGQLGETLFGYNSTPSLTEIISYGGYFLIVWLLIRLPAISGRNPHSNVKAA